MGLALLWALRPIEIKDQGSLKLSASDVAGFVRGQAQLGADYPVLVNDTSHAALACAACTQTHIVTVSPDKTSNS